MCTFAVSHGTWASTFIELMNMATRDVEFSFNNIMFVQIDGMAMGSPFGPMLATIFFCLSRTAEVDQVAGNSIPHSVLQICIWHILTVWISWSLWLLLESIEFSSSCPQVHNGIGTFWLLTFLDVLVERSASSFSTSIYRNPTVIGRYTRWDS